MTTSTTLHSVIHLTEAMLLARKHPAALCYHKGIQDDGTVVETARFGKYKDMVLTIVTKRPCSPTRIECHAHIVGKQDNVQEQLDCIAYTVSEIERTNSMLIHAQRAA